MNEYRVYVAVLVNATSEEHAKEVAADQMAGMDRDELLTYVYDAIETAGETYPN